MRPFVRPTEAFIHVEREAVEGGCPECRGQRLARYPVVSEGGWWNVVKCQDCLASVERQRGNPIGSLSLLSDDL